jgi:hypothetical protein
MRELTEIGLVSSFQVGRGFGEGRAPACWYLTKPGLVEIADAKDARTSDLPWVPDSSYRTSKMIAHRLGVNAFFCALAEASRAFEGHCLATWRPEHWVRTKAAEIKPDGFGRYLHPGGACEFYLENDRATEGRGALTRKLEGYLRLAAGWTKEQELMGFPNVLVLVPEEEREGEVATAYHSATTSLHISGSLASSFPLYVASEDRFTELGVLGASWQHIPNYRPDPAICTEQIAVSAGTSPTPIPAIGVVSLPPPPRPDSAPCRPDMHLEAAARGRAKRSRSHPPTREWRGPGAGSGTMARRSRRRGGGDPVTERR